MPGGAGSLPHPVHLMRGKPPALEVGHAGASVQPGLLAVFGHDHGELHQEGQVSSGGVYLRPRAAQSALDLEV